MKKKINIGLIGCGFMGRTHSNAYRKVNQFFDLEYQPVMKVLSARPEDKAMLEAFAPILALVGRAGGGGSSEPCACGHTPAS